MSSTKESQNPDNPDVIIQASVNFITRLNVISNKELRKSLQSDFVKILDLALVNYSECMKIIRKADDLVADLSLESTMAVFDIECKLQEIDK